MSKRFLEVSSSIEPRVPASSAGIPIFCAVVVHSNIWAVGAVEPRPGLAGITLGHGVGRNGCPASAGVKIYGPFHRVAQGFSWAGFPVASMAGNLLKLKDKSSVCESARPRSERAVSCAA